VYHALTRRGASFLPELVSESRLLPTQVEQALGELAALGLVTSDSFAGLRALLTPSAKRQPLGGGIRRHRTAPFGIEAAGRWSLLNEGAREPRAGERGSDEVEGYARVLLRRYGVVFHRLLARESLSVPWRELLLVYRRLEARGEVRGGRFVAGVTGEQFALPEAVVSLRAVRREEGAGSLIAISAADPLNLVGILTPGERIAALARNRIVFRDGVPLAVLEAGEVRLLKDAPLELEAELTQALTRRPTSPKLRRYLGMGGRALSAVPKRSRERSREHA
jgi:ATP-dependent Lhr-like helicase